MQPAGGVVPAATPDGEQPPRSSAEQPSSSSSSATGTEAPCWKAAVEGFLQSGSPTLPQLFERHLPRNLSVAAALCMLSPVAKKRDVDDPPAAALLRRIQWHACGRIWLWHRHHPASSSKDFAKRYIRQFGTKKERRMYQRQKQQSQRPPIESVLLAHVTTILSQAAFRLGHRDQTFASFLRGTLHPVLRRNGGAVGASADSAALQQFVRRVFDFFEVPLFAAAADKDPKRGRTSDGGELEFEASPPRRRPRKRPSAAVAPHPPPPVPNSSSDNNAAARPRSRQGAGLSHLLLLPSEATWRPSCAANASGGSKNALLQGNQTRASFVGSHFRTDAAALWRQQVPAVVASSASGAAAASRLPAAQPHRSRRQQNTVVAGTPPQTRSPAQASLPFRDRGNSHHHPRPLPKGIDGLVPETPAIPPSTQKKRGLDDYAAAGGNSDASSLRGRGWARPTALRYE